ncbi:response regulator [Geoglobus acetivorans]|uniref:Chemotaxis regulator n=1 Tax=Geoglobus acetivorans TaxID=565033 RepID=A0A0A7GGN4_GEOAI|nr:Chemotaxis regulator [Geoglobus acetivorans]
MTRKKVMIVEDDDAVLEVLKVMLSKGNCQILVAKNGQEAIDLYRFAKPDLVLMDIELPVIDGITATKEIKKLDPNAKIIGVTAYSRSKGKHLIEAGALDIIDKPFTKKKIFQILERYTSVC